MPWKLQDLQVASKITERTFWIKFLGVTVEKNVICKDHIHTIKNK